LELEKPLAAEAAEEAAEKARYSVAPLCVLGSFS
jgi:hypothetical protein